MRRQYDWMWKPCCLGAPGGKGLMEILPLFHYLNCVEEHCVLQNVLRSQKMLYNIDIKYILQLVSS